MRRSGTSTSSQVRSLLRFEGLRGMELEEFVCQEHGIQSLVDPFEGQH